MAAHNSRKSILSTKNAEQLRTTLISEMGVEHLGVEKSAPILVSYLIASYLEHRNIAPVEKIYPKVLAYLGENEATFPFITTNLDYDSIGYLIDYVFQHQLAHHPDNKDADNRRKSHGAYYTPFHIADYIVRNTIDFQLTSNFSVLDPACGSGVFLSAVALLLSENNFSKIEITRMLHGWDKNEEAIAISKLILAGELGLSECELFEFMDNGNFVQKDTLLEPIQSSDLFGQCTLGQKEYTYIVANPPYDRLKPDNLPENGKKEVLSYVSAIKASQQYPLSSNGSLELYRLFLERILQLMSTSGGKAGLIIPRSFTNDKSALLLRERILSKGQLRKVDFIPEKARAFEGVSQAFCILLLNSETVPNFSTSTCVVSADLGNNTTRKASTKRLKEAFPSDYNLIDMSDEAYQLVSHLNTFPSVSELKEIKNRRGEFDLSFNKDLIRDGERKLLRGKGLFEYGTKEHDQVDYDGFLHRIKGTSKYNDVLSTRIACQQIANMDAKKRLKFALIPPKTILGNSLNYLMLSTDSKYRLYGLLAIMNSLLLDWRFRITSSNNHVNNYEVDKLPLPKDLNHLDDLGMYLEKNFHQLSEKSFRATLERKILELYSAEDYLDTLAQEHPLGDLLRVQGERVKNMKEAAYA